MEATYKGANYVKYSWPIRRELIVALQDILLCS